MVVGDDVGGVGEFVGRLVTGALDGFRLGETEGLAVGSDFYYKISLCKKYKGCMGGALGGGGAEQTGRGMSGARTKNRFGMRACRS